MKEQTFSIERSDGSRYAISMLPGELLTLRPDESLVVPEPPKLDAPVAITVLNDHERRIKWLEEITKTMTRHYPNNIHFPDAPTYGPKPMPQTTPNIPTGGVER